MEEARAVMLLVGYGERKTAGSLLTPGRLLGFRDEREICDKFAPPAEVTYDLDARIFKVLLLHGRNSGPKPAAQHLTELFAGAFPGLGHNWLHGRPVKWADA